MVRSRLSFLIALLTVFINIAGVGIAFSFLHTLSFDTEKGLLPECASANLRGSFFGLVVAAFTFMPFLFSPIIGTLSDQRGRRSLLLPTLFLSGISFGISALSVEMKSMYGLLLSRILAGIAASNVPVAQAVVADLSTPLTRLKNFGYVAIAVGSGFTLGPFLGGILSVVSLSFPFLFFSLFSFLLFFATLFFFEETYQPKEAKPLSFLKGFWDLKKVFQIEKLRFFILMMCIFFFGWEIFFPFASIFLCARYGYGITEIGIFYGVAGGFFTLGGYLLRVATGFPLRSLFQISVPLFALILSLMWLFPSVTLFWILLIPLMLLAPLFFTGAFTYVSSLSGDDEQGEMLGIYNSLQQFALTFPPLLFGPFVGRYPEFVVLGAAFFCFLAWIPSLFIPKTN